MRRVLALMLPMMLAAAIAAVPAAQDTMVIRGVGTFPTEGPRGTPAASLTGTALIVGRVVDADSGQPVPGATVTPSGGVFVTPATPFAAEAPPSSLTNGQGHFLLRSLPAGGYSLRATAPGYLPTSYGARRPDGGSARTVELADGQRVTDVEIRIWKFGVITGTVEDEVGEPVVGANIRAFRRDASGRLQQGPSASTDDRGVYRIANLMPGEYLVLASSTYSALPGGVVEMLRTPGQPLQSALSRDVPFLGLGNPQGISIGDMVALPGLMGLGASMMTTPDESGRLNAYATTFHPSATSPAGATVVRVMSGAERAEVDVRLTLTRMFSVSGTVTGPDGPISNLGIRLVPLFSEAFASDMLLETATTATGPGGRFTFLGVPAGQYEIRALRMPTVQTLEMMQTVTMNAGNTISVVRMGTSDGQPPPIADEPTYWARVPVEVTTRDVSGVAVALTTGTRLNGQVIFDGGNPPPVADRRRLGVNLMSSDDRTGTSLPLAAVEENLSFRTPQYPAGRFLVNVVGVPAGWVAVDARVGSVNALVEPIAPSGGEMTGVVITLSTRAPKVSGTVRGASSGDPQATVVVFPADHRAWVEAGMSARLVRTAAVRPNGAYEVTGLVPGAYAVVAVPETTAVETRSPAFFDAVARSASRITVSLGESATQALTVTPVR